MKREFTEVKISDIVVAPWRQIINNDQK